MFCTAAEIIRGPKHFQRLDTRSAAAKKIEVELMSDVSGFSQHICDLSELFADKSSDTSKNILQSCLTSSQSANVNSVKSDSSMHLSGSITSSNQAFVQGALFKKTTKSYSPRSQWTKSNGGSRAEEFGQNYVRSAATSVDKSENSPQFSYIILR